MVLTRLGKRYAKALLDLAREKGQIEEVKADIEKLRVTIDSSREFRLMIKSPVIKPDKKIAIFREIFADELSEITRNFIEIVTRKGREASLIDVAHSFMDIYRKEKGIAQATVTTAIALEDAEKENIKKHLAEATGQEIVIEEVVDPSIIGGLKLRVADKQFDGTIAHQLEALKRQFKNNLYVPEF